MNRHYLVTAISICITACAAPVPESQRPVESAESEKPAPASDDAVAVNVPQESVRTVNSGTTDMSKRNYVCKRERQTGSNRAKRVCRTRAQIAQEELEGKDTFEQLHRSQDEYD